MRNMAATSAALLPSFGRVMAKSKQPTHISPALGDAVASLTSICECTHDRTDGWMMAVDECMMSVDGWMMAVSNYQPHFALFACMSLICRLKMRRTGHQQRNNRRCDNETALHSGVLLDGHVDDLQYQGHGMHALPIHWSSVQCTRRSTVDSSKDYLAQGAA